VLASGRPAVVAPGEIVLDIAASPPLAPRAGLLDRLRASANTGNLAAMVAFGVAVIVYIRTLLPGVGFGDWADAQLNPYRLGVMHPTGYPLYTLIGKAFTLIPVDSVAWRMNLLSAVAAAAAVGVAVLIMVRLGVRPVIAAGAGLALAFTGTLWQEATFAEMNSLHLLLVALLLHRALVWRADRRDRDLLIGALLAGLCVSNHGLAITVVPIVAAFVVVDARRELAATPWLLARTGAAFVVGLLPYLYLPLRALAGPADVYGTFLTWDGFFAHVSGQQFRGAMHFLTEESVTAAVGAMPQIVDQVVSLSNVLFVGAGLAGVVLLLLRDRWFGLLVVALGVVNVYFYANYMGDLTHYLLTTWLILAIGLGYAAELGVRLLAGRLGTPAGAALAYAVVVLSVAMAVVNWPTHDQSANHDGERFTAEVFAALPENAVLVTYWDALTPLSYEHCVEGVSPNVSLRAYDEHALVTCDLPIPRPLTEVVKRRPVYALVMFPKDLRGQTGLDPVRTATMIRLPYGKRYAEYDAFLYQLVADASMP
jgi:Protein of unknown function (DUF2723)